MMIGSTAVDGVARKVISFLGGLCFLFCCSGCVVVPKAVYSEEDSRCRLTSRKVTLEVSESGPNAALKGALRVTTECRSAECLLIVPAAMVAIPVGSVVVSGSIMVAGNTIHWLEAQGRCADSVTRSAVNNLLEGTKAAGGMVIESYRDLSAWLENLLAQAAQPPTESEAVGQAVDSNPEKP